MKAIALAVFLVSLAAFGATKFVAYLTSTTGASVNTVLVTTAPNYPVWAGVRCDAPANVQTGTAYADGGGVAAAGTDPIVLGGDFPEKQIQLAPGENGVAVAGADGGTAHCWVYRISQF